VTGNFIRFSQALPYFPSLPWFVWGLRHSPYHTFPSSPWPTTGPRLGLSPEVCHGLSHWRGSPSVVRIHATDEWVLSSWESTQATLYFRHKNLENLLWVRLFNVQESGINSVQVGAVSNTWWHTVIRVWRYNVNCVADLAHNTGLVSEANLTLKYLRYMKIEGGEDLDWPLNEAFSWPARECFPQLFAFLSITVFYIPWQAFFQVYCHSRTLPRPGSICSSQDMVAVCFFLFFILLL